MKVNSGKEHSSGEGIGALRAVEADGQTGLVGRELDIAIAERVMCWPRRDRDDGTDYSETYFSAFPDGGQIIVYRGGDQRQAERWSPAQNIAAAMEVASAVIRKGWTFELRWIAVWMARFQSLVSGKSEGYTAQDPAMRPAEVICRAALAAVAHNEPERNAETLLDEVESSVQSETELRYYEGLDLLPYEIAESLPSLGGRFGELARLCKSHVAAHIEKVIKAKFGGTLQREPKLRDEDDFTHYFNATSRLRKENDSLRQQVSQLEREREAAMDVLAPSMPESGLVDAYIQLKQAYISEADNAEHGPSRTKAALIAKVREMNRNWQSEGENEKVVAAERIAAELEKAELDCDTIHQP